MENEIKSQLNSISVDVNEIKVTLAVQAEQLKEHMRRSDLLEQRIEQVDRDIKPAKTFFMTLSGLLRLAAGATVLLGLVELLRKFF